MTKNISKPLHKMLDGKIYTRRLIYETQVFDLINESVDPAILLNERLEWTNCEMSQWLQDKGQAPTVDSWVNGQDFCTDVRITAYLTDVQWTEFILRFT